MTFTLAALNHTKNVRSALAFATDVVQSLMLKLGKV